jgi:hypothetical protein
LTNISYRIHQFRIKEAGERRRKLNNPELPKNKWLLASYIPSMSGKEGE